MQAIVATVFWKMPKRSLLVFLYERLLVLNLCLWYYLVILYDHHWSQFPELFDDGYNVTKYALKVSIIFLFLESNKIGIDFVL